MRFSVTGFIVGAICAIIFVVVALALVSFHHDDLVFGLIGLLIWGLLTFNWNDGWVRRQP